VNLFQFHDGVKTKLAWVIGKRRRTCHVQLSCPALKVILTVFGIALNLHVIYA
jgi:hypothetical protein